MRQLYRSRIEIQERLAADGDKEKTTYAMLIEVFTILLVGIAPFHTAKESLLLTGRNHHHEERFG